MIAFDPLLSDPEGGDFSPLPGSPSQGYGCQTFRRRGADRTQGIAGGFIKAGTRLPTAGLCASAQRRSSMDASGLITADTDWDADTVRVTGDIVIDDQALLRIRPGVRVEFQGYYSIEIDGTLEAIGAPSMPIHFTSSNPELYAVDSTLAGSWGGLRFTQTTTWNPQSRLEHCIIEYAKNAGGPGRGGAVYVDGTPKAELYNCVIRHNAADYGGALFLSRNASIRVSGCLIHDNHAFRGGSAVYTANSYPILTNNTITANVVLNEDIYEDTGTIHTYMAKPRLGNCISWANVCDFFIPGDVLWGKPHYMTYNNLQHGNEGVGNFHADPLFIGAGAHPFALDEFSPCRNAGDPMTEPGMLLPVDIRGLNRILEGRIDVGAYEWGDPADVAEDDGRRSPFEEPVAGVSPNPSLGEAMIAFQAGDARGFRAEIYSLSGRRIRSISGRTTPFSRTEFAWDGRADCGRDAGPGVFFCRIILDGGEQLGCKVVRLRE